MARVTKLVSGEQINYRLTQGAGCGLEHGRSLAETPGVGHGHAPGIGHGHPGAEVPEGDRQVDYRMPDGLPVAVVGDGLAEFGMSWGHVLTEDQKDMIRDLANGLAPRTAEQRAAEVEGERLVPQVLRTDPAGMLPAGPLLDAIEKAAADRGVENGAALIAAAGFEETTEDFGRLARGVDHKGEAHKISFDRADLLAYTAGVNLGEIYGPAAAVAARNKDRRIDIRVKAYDLEIDQPKSHSVLYAAADVGAREVLDRLYNGAIDDTLRLLQHDLAYSMSGHHGDGEKAARVRTAGLLATRLDHRVARPVQGQAPDPHQHAHIMIMNLAHGEDGEWRAVAGGGMDLYRHAVAVNEMVDHQYRTELIKLGARFERVNGAWELVGIGPQLRALFSKRSAQVAEELRELGIAPDEASGDQRVILIALWRISLIGSWRHQWGRGAVAGARDAVARLWVPR
jgi:conjugative relaxase-like TrwC/TraI family protein